MQSLEIICLTTVAVIAILADTLVRLVKARKPHPGVEVIKILFDNLLPTHHHDDQEDSQ